MNKPNVGDTIKFDNSESVWEVAGIDVDIITGGKGVKLSRPWEGIRLAVWYTWDQYFSARPQKFEGE